MAKKNTINIYNGHSFAYTVKIYRGVVKNPTKRLIYSFTDATHDISVSGTYIISGSSVLNCKLTVYHFPVNLAKQIMRDEGFYYFRAAEDFYENVTSVEFVAVANGDNLKRSFFFNVARARPIGDPKDGAFVMVGSPALDTLIDRQTIAEIYPESQFSSGIMKYELKRAIAAKYNRQYLSFDPKGDAALFVYQHKKEYVENLIEFLARDFPDQTHKVDNFIITCYPKVGNLTFLGQHDDLYKNTVDYCAVPTGDMGVIESYLKGQISSRPTWVYHDNNNAIYDFVTLEGVQQVAVTVPYTPSIQMGDKVIICSNVNNNNKLFNLPEGYYVQSVEFNAKFAKHEISNASTRLVLSKTEIGASKVQGNIYGLDK